MGNAQSLPQQTLSTFIACYLACWAVNIVQSASAKYGLGSITTGVVTALVAVFTLVSATSLPAPSTWITGCRQKTRTRTRTRNHASHQRESSDQTGDATAEQLKDEACKRSQVHKKQPSITDHLTQVLGPAEVEPASDTTNPIAGTGDYVTTETKPTEEKDDEPNAENASDTTEETLVQTEAADEQDDHKASIETKRKTRRNRKSKAEQKAKKLRQQDPQEIKGAREAYRAREAKQAHKAKEANKKLATTIECP